MPSPPLPSPGPRLSRDGILEAYIGLADREGPDAVSLRRLGIELGADPTALYRHFRDKDALLEAVADRLLNDLADRHRAGGAWRDEIQRICLEGRRMYMTHPRLARVIAASPEPMLGNMRLAEIILGHLRAAGLSDREAALGYEALATYVAGGSSLDADIGAAASEWSGSVADLDAQRFPNAVAVAEALYLDDDVAFEFGLDLMLDGL